MESHKTKYFFLSLRIAVVIAGLIWAILWFSGEDCWNRFTNLFAGTNSLVFIAPLLGYFFSQVVVGLRWWLIIRTQKISISPWVAVRLHLLGLFYNVLLPSAVGGDVVRAWYVTKHTHKRFEAVLSIFVDRALGFVSMMALAGSTWLIFLRGRHIEELNLVKAEKFTVFMARNYFAVVLTLVIIISAGFIATRHPRIRQLLKRAFRRMTVFFLRGYHKTRDAGVMYRKKPFTLISVLFITVASQSILVLTLWFFGYSLDIPAGLKFYFVFFPASWVLGALPVSIGGAVIVEGWLVLLFTKFAGISVEQALALALCQRVVWLLCAIPGMGIHLIGAHLPKNFSVDYD